MPPRTFEVDLPVLRLVTLVFSVWGLLSGCTGPTYSYSKACVQEPRISGGASETPMIVGGRTDGKREAKLYRMCMEANGWTAEAPR
jgi:hypothetical protein